MEFEDEDEDKDDPRSPNRRLPRERRGSQDAGGGLSGLRPRALNFTRNTAFDGGSSKSDWLKVAAPLAMGRQAGITLAFRHGGCFKCLIMRDLFYLQS